MTQGFTHTFGIPAPPKNARHGSARVRLNRPAPSELGYLSWGKRHYGEPPIAPGTHEGWHYFVVLSGTPNLVIHDRHVALAPGSVSVGHPDCAIGHHDRPGRGCEMLTWIWRTPPVHSALQPASGTNKMLQLNHGQLRRLKQLHLECREAVADSNERSMLRLRATRILIDLCLHEAIEQPPAPDPRVQVDLAVQYLRSHVGEQQAMHAVCEYLRIPKATLARLFREHLGTSPREFAQTSRMEWAREQLRDAGASVKAVAFALGYRHAPDFSRAFKEHFGRTASSVVPQRKAP